MLLCVWKQSGEFAFLLLLSLELPVKVLRPEPLDTFAYDHPIWSGILIPFEVAVAIPWCFLLLIIKGQDCLG